MNLSDLEVAVENLPYFRLALMAHIKEVDNATKLTQRMPNSQLKEAKKVLKAFDIFLEEANQYIFMGRL